MNPTSKPINLYWIAVCTACFWLGSQMASLFGKIFWRILPEQIQNDILLYTVLANLFRTVVFSLTTFFVIWFIARTKYKLPAAFIPWTVAGFSITGTLLSAAYFQLQRQVLDNPSLYSLLPETITTQGAIQLPLVGTPSPADVLLWTLLSIIPGLFIGAVTGTAQVSALKDRVVAKKRWILAVAITFAINAVVDAGQINIITFYHINNDSYNQGYQIGRMLMVMEVISTFLVLPIDAIYGMLTSPLIKVDQLQLTSPVEELQSV